VVIALIVGGIVGYVIGNAGGAGSPGGTASSTAQAMLASNNRAVQLQLDMRKLWTDHTVWTRDYIVAAVAGAPDADAAAARLMKNQEDIGNAVASYYGADAGKRLTDLLKQHISIAVDLIKAAKANNQTMVSTEQQKWQENGNQIADFLASANPTNWPQSDLRALMKKHLETTTDEVLARLNKDWAADVRAYDTVYDHILMMADALSSGIIKQFPDKFK
jgi:hypothetical protein